MTKFFLITLCYAFFSLVFVARGENVGKPNVESNNITTDSIQQEKILHELNASILLAEEQNDLEQVASLYHKKGKYLLDQVRYNEAQEALLKAYALIDNVNDLSSKYAINLHLGMSYSFLGMLPQSFPYFDDAYALADSVGDPLFIARARHFAATKDLVSGEFVEAARKLYNSYQVLLENNDTTHLLYICNDIGAFFSIFAENDYALEFFNYALHYDSLVNTPDRSFRSLILANMGAIYSENLKDYTTAEKYFKESLAASKPNTSWLDQLYARSYLAAAQIQNEDYNTALSFFEKAYNDERLESMSSYYPFVVTHYGLVLFKLGDYVKAKRISTEAYQLSSAINSWQETRVNLETLYKIDSINGNYQSALTHYQGMIEAQRSKLDEEGKMEYIRLEVEQEIEKMSAQREELLAANQEYIGTIQKLTKLSGRQKLVILLFVVLAIALFIELLRNRKLNKQLKQSEEALKVLNQSLEKKVKERTIELEKANLELLQLDDAKTEFLNIISHEIRTPLNGIVGMLGILDVSELPDNLKEFLKIIQISSDRLESFSYKALDISMLATKAKEALTLYRGNLINTIKICIVEKQPQLAEKQLEVLTRFNVNEAVFSYDESLLKKAICMIMDNAIKFANEASQITVRLTKIENAYEISITDIGELFPENNDEIQIRPFKTGFKHVDMNPGLSLYLSKLILEAHDGSVSLKNNEDGVTVRLIIPKP
ncbi:tetratricopeptide repeat-containing sensor histidine kinase [Draconibacterium sp. IB214405]|uniref:ATP-binding protein n=1 Tax=Draconibacterium sp. IB214405 TaxID=3097352 RepID=UPI002A155966|nr:tetratricopeptide repeat-containing sensor histidine kinase [Draconibacterium sp. IB214405]MDX8340425.1 tetratricopeptide repeat-containing sensor histidine kinase [Draconibacterium sp. IB214405]